MKRSLVIIIMLGLFLSACGQNRQEQIAQQDSRHDDVVKEDDVQKYRKLCRRKKNG